MKKIVTNALIVGLQLIVGGLFLFMLFSDNNEDSRVVVVQNNNLNKMADSVNELFVVEKGKIVETGNHTNLLANKGAYSKLFYAQQELEKYGKEA